MSYLPTPTIPLCQPRSVIVEHNFTGPLNVYSGLTQLETKLENVVALKVVYFGVTLNADTDLSPLQGTLFGLYSSKLGSALVNNSFWLDTGSNITTLSSAHCVPLIGWNNRIYTNSNYVSSSDLYKDSSDVLLRFSKPTHLDQFDWTIQPLNASLPNPMTHNYSVKLVLQFYQICTCQNRFKFNY